MGSISSFTDSSMLCAGLLDATCIQVNTTDGSVFIYYISIVVLFDVLTNSSDKSGILGGYINTNLLLDLSSNSGVLHISPSVSQDHFQISTNGTSMSFPASLIPGREGYVGVISSL